MLAYCCHTIKKKKKKKSEELDKLVREDIFVTVETSEWGTPIVSIIKSGWSIRLCSDYKVTLNKFLKVDRYSILRVNDSVYFEKLNYSVPEICLKHTNSYF
jgi:hypothetical protein